MFFFISWISLVVPSAAILIILIQRKINKYIYDYSKQKSKTGDLRAKKINEIVSGIKLIKFNAWENIVREQLKDLRRTEKYFIRRIFFLSSLVEALANFMPVLAAVVTFWLYDVFWPEDPLDIGEVYALLTIFSSMIQPLKSLIDSIQLRVTTRVIDQRYDELVPLASCDQNSDDLGIQVGEMIVENCCFKWPEDQKTVREVDDRNFVLEDINLHIKPMEFVTVIGSVGSGKSSLVLGLMQELEADPSDKSKQFKLSKRGRIAYVPQESFLINDSIKNNILFGRALDQSKLDECIKLCELLDDLKNFKAGIHTEIGDKGITLSGG